MSGVVLAAGVVAVGVIGNPVAGSTVSAGPSAAAPASTLESQGSFGAAIATVSVDTVLGSTHYTVLADATDAALTLTLPAAAGCARRIYNIKKIDASANAVTVEGDGAETIDGAANYPLPAQWNCVQIQCNGTAWFILQEMA